jgi:S-formylglutathione hydrolase FrmB
VKIIGIAFLLFISLQLQAATVDTVSIYSEAMKRSFKCVVIQPKKPTKKKKFPVVYLLHGYDGWYSNWIIRVPELKNYADRFRLIIVCPEGHKSSWYFDSPVDSAMRFETYIGREVPAYIDKHYPTIKSRKSRAITGLSMGGHGALFIAFRNADRFGACGSMSGLMDLFQTRKSYDLIKRIGDTVIHAENWKKLSIINLIEKEATEKLSIIIDCGVDDFTYHGNKAIHEKMLKLKIPHEYIERPGNHSWEYWRNAVKYQLFFFENFFNNQ